jgi:hypothetical protein
MGIRFYCPQGHKLNVKSFLAGKKGFCPHCNAKVDVPLRSTRPSSKEDKQKSVQSAMMVPMASPGAGAGVLQEAPLARPVAAPAQSAPMALPLSVSAVSSPASAVPHPALRAGPGPTLTVPMHAPTPASAPAPSPTILPVGSPAPSVQVAAAPAAPAMPAPAPTGQPWGAPAQQAATGTAPDPIAEAPHAVWYVRPAMGGQFGPASGEMMRQWIEQGRVAADSLVWRDGWPAWQPAGAILPQTAGGLRGLDGGLPDATNLGLSMPLDPLPVTSRPHGRPGRKRANFVLTLILVLLGVIALALGGVLLVMLK